jgi:outer membrane receptor for ferrienterochelin and colicin
MKSYRYLVVLVVLLVASVSAFAQTTGVLTGTVTTDGNPLPGATVSVSSPSLQGTRTAVTDANGNYNIAALPPGDYTVKTELSGMSPVTRTVRVTLSGTARSDAELRLSSVTEAITVTASSPAVLETTEIEANYQKKLVDDLPIGRTVTAVALLAPGTTANGPRGGLQISGSFASDNLIMVNGANVQENLRGQARPLFIEDAIQETTVITGAVSAEYGRFTGGVVNSITKSGGNEFSGTFRDSFDNPRWTAQSDAKEARPNSTLNQTYEATLGGRIIRDRLWFFAAGRMAETTATGAPVNVTGQTLESATENKRYEVKLTGQITPKHSLVGNYLSNPLSSTNNNQLGVYEVQALDPEISQEEDFKAAHYSGVFTNNLLGEVNWSKRAFTFVGFGGENRDAYIGTPIFIGSGSGSGQGIANAPYFCGSCDNELRDNDLITAKLTYFLGTKALGTHNLVGGVERFKESRLSNNYQSPTNLVVEMYTSASRVTLVNGQPVFKLNPGDDVAYYPVEIPSIGSDLKTDSLFVNDKWDFNRYFSFNLGARYDKTDAKDQEGNPTANDSAISPRVSAIYDVMGNGRIRLNASYANYVGRLAEGVQGQGSGAGSPAGYYYYYDGPVVSGTSAQIVKAAIDWLKGYAPFVNGFPNPALADSASIGGVNVRVREGDLKAPGVDEWTIGGGFQIGSNGFVRADYIDRKWNNYYAQFTDTHTGQVVEPITGATFDLTEIANTDLLTRTYKAVQMQAQYRLFNRLNLGGNYTYSKLRGNAEGENTGNGPISEGAWIFQYPEYQGFAQNRPTGYLSGDQRHKLRAWAAMDFALGPVGRLNVSLLERFDSGTPFSVSATVPARRDPASGTAPLGYVSVPVNVTYFLEGRGSRRWDDITRTDLALNYSLPISRFELFFEGEVINALNEQGQIAGGTAVTKLKNWNAYTETPVLGTHYSFPASFGAVRTSADLQLARTYQFSVGARF